jgi:hypothetical protein
MNTNEENNLNLTAPHYIFGKRIGFLAKLFGCRHRDLSRPFTYGRQSYRACLRCGARRNFNTETLTSSGAFYYPPNPARDFHQG